MAGRSPRAARRSPRGRSSGLLERRAELPHRGKRTGLHGAERDRQFLGDLDLRLTVEIGHLEYLSLWIRELRHGLSDLFAADTEIPGIGNGVRWVFVGHGLEVRRLLGPGAQALLPADEVDAAVAHHRPGEAPARTAAR